MAEPMEKPWLERVSLPAPEDSTRFEVGQVYYVAFVDRHKGEIGLSLDLPRVGYRLFQEMQTVSGKILLHEVIHG